MKKTVIAFALLATTVLISTHAAKNESQSRFITVSPNKAGNLVVPTEQITSTARFINYKTDSATVQLVAVRAPDDSVRVAFNTCQSCNPSPRAFFMQKGNKLVCQNCGNSFTMQQVGIMRGGCNPAYIEQKEISADKITIPAAYLAQFAPRFKRWAGPTSE